MFNEENTVEQMVLDTLCGGACNRSQGGLLHGL